MSKIIGLVVAWSCEDWIESCISQAIEYCDEVLVCVAPHTEEMEKFEDKTFDIASKFSNIKLFKSTGRSHHAVEKANILNSMLNISEYFEVGNWIWILDSDEFYTKDTYNQIKQTIEKDEYDAIRTNERYFYINMQHYLESNRCRLRKIKSKDNRFIPTQKWIYAENEVMLEDAFMFHYGILNNFESKMEFWKSEYPGTEQSIKVDWLDKIYRNYDLDNEEYWIKENEKLCGLKSPWFEDNFKPDKDRKLFKYNEEHPKFVRHLERINDFRGVYDFK